MGVVGVQDGIQGQEGIGNASFPQGHGDGNAGVAGANPASLDMRVNDGTIAGGWVRVQGCHGKHRRGRLSGQMGYIQDDPEDPEQKSFQLNVLRQHLHDISLEVQGDRGEFRLKLDDVIVQIAEGRPG
jgi:hypothetical protein